MEPAATSVALFVGWTPRGETREARRVRGLAEFEEEFGGPSPRAPLGHAVRHFFENGGTDARIVRVPAEDEVGPDDPTFLAAVLASFGPDSAAARLESFNLACAPGVSDAPTLTALQRFCRDRGAFLLADGAENDTVETVEATAQALRGDVGRNSAIYFPWVEAPDPLAEGAPRAFPPSGFVAGVVARTDATRGVWASPAGTHATLVGASGLMHRVSDDVLGRLGRASVNCLRTFPGQGPVVWGARTLARREDMPQWSHVAPRRTLLYVEDSIRRGIAWAVFEPNAEALWVRVRGLCEDFLARLWRSGGLHGSTARHAFFVQCDRTTMTPDDVAHGRLLVQVGLALVRPAEFVVLLLQQATGEPPGG